MKKLSKISAQLLIAATIIYPFTTPARADLGFGDLSGQYSHGCSTASGGAEISFTNSDEVLIRWGNRRYNDLLVVKSFFGNPSPEDFETAIVFDVGDSPIEGDEFGNAWLEFWSDQPSNSPYILVNGVEENRLEKCSTVAQTIDSANRNLQNSAAVATTQVVETSEDVFATSPIVVQPEPVIERTGSSSSSVIAARPDATPNIFAVPTAELFGPLNLTRSSRASVGSSKPQPDQANGRAANQENVSVGTLALQSRDDSGDTAASQTNDFRARLKDAELNRTERAAALQQRQGNGTPALAAKPNEARSNEARSNEARSSAATIDTANLDTPKVTRRTVARVVAPPPSQKLAISIAELQRTPETAKSLPIVNFSKGKTAGSPTRLGRSARLNNPVQLDQRSSAERRLAQRAIPLPTPRPVVKPRPAPVPRPRPAPQRAPLANAGFGPSFNCNTATLNVERLICASDELSSLDLEAVTILNQHRTGLSPAGKSKLDSEFDVWQKRRNSCWKKRQKQRCLETAYTVLIGEIVSRTSSR